MTNLCVMLPWINLLETQEVFIVTSSSTSACPMSRLISSISVSSSSCFRFRSSNLSNFSCIRSLASPSPAPAMYNCVFSRVIQGIFRVNGLNEFKDSVKDVEFVVSGNTQSYRSLRLSACKIVTILSLFLEQSNHLSSN